VAKSGNDWQREAGEIDGSGDGMRESGRCGHANTIKRAFGDLMVSE